MQITVLLIQDTQPPDSAAPAPLEAPPVPLTQPRSPAAVAEPLAEMAPAAAKLPLLPSLPPEEPLHPSFRTFTQARKSIDPRELRRIYEGGEKANLLGRSSIFSLEISETLGGQIEKELAEIIAGAEEANKTAASAIGTDGKKK